jgi:hypothetical protein
MTDGTGRRALPPETRRALDFDELIATLRLLDGEQVCLSLNLGPGDSSSRLRVIGELRQIDDRGGMRFAIGTDVRLAPVRGDFIEASLWTFDGNDFFQIALTFQGGGFRIGDVGSLDTGEFVTRR